MRLKFNIRAQQIFRADRIPLASDSRLYIAATAVFDSELYESKVENNVYTPEQYADNWTEV